jgi:hypothetical protein
MIRPADDEQRRCGDLGQKVTGQIRAATAATMARTRRSSAATSALRTVSTEAADRQWPSPGGNPVGGLP